MKKIDKGMLDELRLNLKRHYGSMSEVARRADVTIQMVRLVLIGERRSSRVLKIAAELWVELETASLKERDELSLIIKQAKSLVAA